MAAGVCSPLWMWFLLEEVIEAVHSVVGFYSQTRGLSLQFIQKTGYYVERVRGRYYDENVPPGA